MFGAYTHLDNPTYTGAKRIRPHGGGVLLVRIKSGNRLHGIRLDQTILQAVFGAYRWVHGSICGFLRETTNTSHWRRQFRTPVRYGRETRILSRQNHRFVNEACHLYSSFPNRGLGRRWRGYECGGRARGTRREVLRVVGLLADQMMNGCRRSTHGRHAHG
jgi:hypothetical protein